MKSLLNIILSFFIVVAVTGDVQSQITAGKITYERKTNLYKKFKDDDVLDWINKTDKIKIDYFELYFNDSISAFKERENDERDYMSWYTEKNKVYQNFKQNTRLTIKTIWSEFVYLGDSLYPRSWKITDSKRNIGGYTCRKAVWEAPDSSRIYAWYCDEISVSTGPESFIGLPGAILGLATEDGGVIYFATRIETIAPAIEDLLPKKSKSKVYNPVELKAKLEKDYGKEKWGKAMIKKTFGYW